MKNPFKISSIQASRNYEVIKKNLNEGHLKKHDFDPHKSVKTYDPDSTSYFRDTYQLGDCFKVGEKMMEKGKGQVIK